MITINGKSYKGKSVSIINNEVIIDGRRVNDSDIDNAKVININIDANIDTLSVDYCETLEITGDCGNISSKNGNISVKGNVRNDVSNKNGNIVCRNVGGDVETKNGDIIHQ